MTRIRIGNGPLIGERRARTTVWPMPRLGVFDPTVDDPPGEPGFTHALPPARQHGLTVHHAPYPDIAQRSLAPLARLNRALADAARMPGLTLTGDQA